MVDEGRYCDALGSRSDWRSERCSEKSIGADFARWPICSGSVLGIVFAETEKQRWGRLQEHQEQLPRMVGHMENTSVAEALAHTLGADELSATFMAAPDLAWIRDTAVLQVCGMRLVGICLERSSDLAPAGAVRISKVLPLLGRQLSTRKQTVTGRPLTTCCRSTVQDRCRQPHACRMLVC